MTMLQLSSEPLGSKNNEFLMTISFIRTAINHEDEVLQFYFVCYCYSTWLESSGLEIFVGGHLEFLSCSLHHP